jgi:hypothetical protein
MGTEDRCADLYDKSRRTAALIVGAHGTQKETEDDESEKNGRGERERADNHAEAGLMSERGQRLLASRNLSIISHRRHDNTQHRHRHRSACHYIATRRRSPLR